MAMQAPRPNDHPELFEPADHFDDVDAFYRELDEAEAGMDRGEVVPHEEIMREFVYPLQPPAGSPPPAS